MIEQLYQRAVLASAAYAEWGRGIASVQRYLTGEGGLSAEQFRTLFDPDNGQYLVHGGTSVGFTEDLNGFSATVFEHRDSHELTAAFRGTQVGFPPTDLVSDLLALLGNPPLPVELLFNQNDNVSDFLARNGLVQNGQLTQPVDFTGHSLGGYLAIMAAYRYGASAGETYTFNGLGLNPLEDIWQRIAADLSGRPLDGSRVHNFFADKGWEFASGPLLSRPGGQLPLFIEDDPNPLSLHNHGIVPVVQSLSVYRVLASLDPSLDTEAGLATIHDILDRAAYTASSSLATITGQLGDLLGGVLATDTYKSDIELFYQAATNLGRQFGIETLPTTGVAALAAADTSEGRSYRYALVNLLPFVATGELAGTAAADANYDAGEYSPQYLADRAAMLTVYNDMNLEDRAHGVGQMPVKYTDLGSGISFDGDDSGYGALANGSPDQYDARRARYVFGSAGDDVDTLAASPHDDHLYGQAGNDTIRGLDGSDYIEGGEGADRLSGDGAGDVLRGGNGNDQLEGGAGDDSLLGGQGSDTYVWNNGDGNDVIADIDSGGDRVVVNGVDLSTLEFVRVSASSPFFIDRRHPEISLGRENDALAITIASGVNSGSISLPQYGAPIGLNFGIALHDAGSAVQLVGAVQVNALGTAADQTAPTAYERRQSAQGGVNWDVTGIGFQAAAVSHYQGGALHGTSGGAFEGGPVADELIGDMTANALHGLGGDDHIQGGGGDDLLEGGAGGDRIVGADGADILFGDARAGLLSDLSGGGARDQFYADQIVDRLNDINVLDGGAGDDFISGGRGTDFIEAGPGVNYLLGGAGDDSLHGGDDRDVIYGDSSLHYRYVELTPGVASEQLEIAFADGSDTTAQYDDVVLAGAGDDTVWGELGNDVLRGGDGNDILHGDRVDDSNWFSREIPAYGVSTAALAEVLHGDDRLFGDAGNDVLYGHGGADLLAGGPGRDVLHGGPGDDVYAYFPGDGLDTIDDTQGVHTLLFSGLAMADLAVSFSSDRVVVGTTDGSEGFELPRAAWPQVRIALETADAQVQRSALSSHYYNGSGELMISVPGTVDVGEDERDGLFAVTDSPAGDLQLNIDAAADGVTIDRLLGGGARMQVIGGGLQFVIDLAAAQIASGLDFISMAQGVPLSMTGFDGANTGGSGDDLLVGSGVADVLNGGTGDDELRGEGGDDQLHGGAGNGRDVLVGGAGDDLLEGGHGPDIYRFNHGDGEDVLSDAEGYHYLEFGASVAADTIVLNYTGISDSEFRLDYSTTDAVRSSGTASVRWFAGVAVDGVPVPLLQRSDLRDGTFYDSRWHDVFEGGAGADTFFASGWGRDVFRFAPGDGEDVIAAAESFEPTLMGQIRLSAGVDLSAVSFTASNGDTVIAYGAADRLTLNTDTVASVHDNVISRFTVVSEADPDWTPVIRAQSYSGDIHGTFGADQIVGGDGPDTVVPGYGDDIIHTGAGNDTILLNDLYLPQATQGIGHKVIVPGGGDDRVQAPLYQGLSFFYQPGDGQDTIVYDWSYSPAHPYRFEFDAAQGIIDFQANGQDAIEFGGSLTIEDLRLVRSGDTLQLLLRDGSGGIRLDNFFTAYDAARPAVGIDTSALFTEGPKPDLLRHPYVLGLVPRTPVTTLRFAGGESYDLSALLDTALEVSAVTLLGTAGPDHLFDTPADDVIDALAGDDVIQLGAGANRVDAGAGNDEITVLGGHNFIAAGQGNDRIGLIGGDNIVQVGVDNGLDAIFFDADNSTVEVQVTGGLTVTDLSISLVPQVAGSAPQVSFNGGGSFAWVGGHTDPATGGWTPDPGAVIDRLRFDSGAVLSGEQLMAIASLPADGGISAELTGGAGGDRLRGSSAPDILIGGGGNDTLLGRGGDDLFLLVGPDQGFDKVVGGEGFDTLLGGFDDDVIGLSKLRAAFSLELIDGGGGHNFIVGNALGNKLDFSATELRHVDRIDAGAGSDVIIGSAGSDVLIGGADKDRLSGRGGNDTYVYTAGDGSDVIDNNDPDPLSVDTLSLQSIGHDQLWLSRKRDHLLLNIVGSDDRIKIKHWFSAADDQLDVISAGGYQLQRDQIDRLVNAMAAFDVPQGVDTMVPAAVRSELAPVLAAAWQPAVS